VSERREEGFEEGEGGVKIRLKWIRKRIGWVKE
jgi:hypothetical protein